MARQESSDASNIFSGGRSQGGRPQDVKPFQIVEIDRETSKFTVVEAGMEVLCDIARNSSIKVIGIVGEYRKGKSYVLNRLCGRQHGFPLGHQLLGKTNGFWVCVQDVAEVNGKKVTTLLLDTQGLDDPEFNQPTAVSGKVFVAAALLSSYLIFNQTGVIGANALEKLQYVGHIASSVVRTEADQGAMDENDTAGFEDFFPPLMFLIRDHHLDLPDDCATERDYLENMLKIQKGNAQKTRDQNFAKQEIKRFFPLRDCFFMEHPTGNTDDLRNIESLEIEMLNPKFNSQMKTFVEMVLRVAPEKVARDQNVHSDGRTNAPTTGGGLAATVRQICEAFNNGKAICIQSIWEATSTKACDDACSRAVEVYGEEFGLGEADFPVEHEVLLGCHAAAKKKASTAFSQIAVGPSYEEKEKEFGDSCAALFERKKTANFEASREKCEAQVDELVKKYKGEYYSTFESYDKFEEEFDKAADECKQKCESLGPYCADAKLTLETKQSEIKRLARMGFEVEEAKADVAEQLEQQKIKDAAHEEEINRLRRDQEEAHQILQDNLAAEIIKREAQEKRMEEQEKEADSKMEAQKKMIESLQASTEEFAKKRAEAEETYRKDQEAARREMKEQMRQRDEESDKKIKAMEAEVSKMKERAKKLDDGATHIVWHQDKRFHVKTVIGNVIDPGKEDYIAKGKTWATVGRNGIVKNEWGKGKYPALVRQEVARIRKTDGGRGFEQNFY